MTSSPQPQAKIPFNKPGLPFAYQIVEVDLRTYLSHPFGRIHGTFGHTDPARIYARFDHAKWMESLQEEAERSSELFVTPMPTPFALPGDRRFCDTMARTGACALGLAAKRPRLARQNGAS